MRIDLTALTTIYPGALYLYGSVQRNHLQPHDIDLLAISPDHPIAELPEGYNLPNTREFSIPYPILKALQVIHSPLPIDLKLLPPVDHWTNPIHADTIFFRPDGSYATRVTLHSDDFFDSAVLVADPCLELVMGCH